MLWLAPEVISTWEAVGIGTRGGQLQYSDRAIETALTLRLLFHLPLRQTEGFLTSIFSTLDFDLSAPDHTTLSRRGQHLDLTLRGAPACAGTHLIVDSTGLSIVGDGEWAAAKHGGRGRRGWKKLHLGVDRVGVIVAQVLTEGHVDDATTGIPLIEAVAGDLGSVTADAAYDTVGFYEAADEYGQRVAIRTAVERPRLHDRGGQGDGTATLEEDVGLPSAGPRGEHVLPVQVDHRRRPASAQSGRAGERGRPRVHHPQSDDGAWQASVVRHRSVRDPWFGTVAGSFRFMHQRRRLV